MEHITKESGRRGIDMVKGHLRRKMENTFMESGKWENLLYLVLKLVENDKFFLKIKFRFEPLTVN